MLSEMEKSVPFQTQSPRTTLFSLFLSHWEGVFSGQRGFGKAQSTRLVQNAGASRLSLEDPGLDGWTDTRLENLADSLTGRKRLVLGTRA